MQTTAARGAWRASLNACSTLLRRPGLSLAATARMSASRRLQRVRGTGKQHGSGFYWLVYLVKRIVLSLTPRPAGRARIAL